MLSEAYIKEFLMESIDHSIFLALSLHASVLKPCGLQLNRLIRAGVHCLKRHFFEANHHALKGILLKLTQST